MQGHAVSRRRLVRAALAAPALAALPAFAQSGYPNRPIKLICPWPAGGTTDQYLRALAQLAGKYLGQSVVVENKPGAGGTLGAQALVAAKPDGYTVSQIPITVFSPPAISSAASSRCCSPWRGGSPTPRWPSSWPW